MLQLSELSPGIPLDGPLIAPLAPWDNYTRGSFLLSVKGAPEVLMPRCSHVLDPFGGPPIAISPVIRDRIADVQENWSRTGQRVLLLARRIIRDNWLEKATDRQSEEFAEVVEEYNRDLIIVGLVGLIDPLKSDIKHTVKLVLGPISIIRVVTYPSFRLAFAAVLESASLSSPVLLASFMSFQLLLIIPCLEQVIILQLRFPSPAKPVSSPIPRKFIVSQTSRSITRNKSNPTTPIVTFKNSRVSSSLAPNL